MKKETLDKFKSMVDKDGNSWRGAMLMCVNVNGEISLHGEGSWGDMAIFGQVLSARIQEGVMVKNANVDSQPTLPKKVDQGAH